MFQCGAQFVQLSVDAPACEEAVEKLAKPVKALLSGRTSLRLAVVVQSDTDIVDERHHFFGTDYFSTKKFSLLVSVGDALQDADVESCVCVVVLNRLRGKMP